MNKVASYLQAHIGGEVLTSTTVRQSFSTDASIFTVMPSMVVYPKNVNDVRKVARFTWQLAEKGHILSMTARGGGTDLSGAAIGKGVVIVFPAHMNQLFEIDPKQGLARVQPGLMFGAFQAAAAMHNLFLPPFPASLDYSTIGGAIANNAAGEKSVKYGAMDRYVESLEVVLANGELIQTTRINKRELNRKKGLTSFEGEIYRQLDGLLIDNAELLQTVSASSQVTKNTAGYLLSQVKQKDGSFDLTPLFLGSQGTLGIVTEAIVRLETLGDQSTLFAVCFDTIEDAAGVIEQLRPLEPSAVEMVDSHALSLLQEANPGILSGLVNEPFPAVVLMIEFDDVNLRNQKHHAKKAEKIVKAVTPNYKMTTDPEEQERFWSIRHGAASAVNYAEGLARAVPVIEDGIVPPKVLPEFVHGIYALFEKYSLDVSIWGHAGDANLHLQPFLDLSKITDRQKLLKLAEEYYSLVLNLGGSTSGEHGDGRVRAPYLSQMYGSEFYQVMTQVKQIFDPYGTLNTGVKIGVTKEELPNLLRRDYTLDRLSGHLPYLG